MNAAEVIDAIDTEIARYLKEEDGDDNYDIGFMAGLIRAKRIIERLQEQEIE